MKEKIIRIVAAVCVLLTCIPFSSCSRFKEKFSKHSFDYFDTVTTVTGYAESRDEFDKVAKDVLAQLDEYHRLYNIYHRFDGLENLCTINELVDGEHRTVTVDERIIDMLSYAKEMYELTDGRINIAMGSVLSIWHEYRQSGIDDPDGAQLPPMDKLTDAAEHTDIDCLVIDKEKSTVTITDPQMKLDVGAIAKGYATEMVARALEERGLSGYILNVGGNVRTIGGKADGEGWTVGVEDPSGKEDYIAYLSLEGESLVTSGSYQRYYLVDGERYHHIIHPDTLMPAEGYLSVSVLTLDSALGDALSTALFCMSLEDGMELVGSISDVEAQWVTSDGTIHTTNGWSEFKSK